MYAYAYGIYNARLRRSIHTYMSSDLAPACKSSGAEFLEHPVLDPVQLASDTATRIKLRNWHLIRFLFFCSLLLPACVCLSLCDQLYYLTASDAWLAAANKLLLPGFWPERPTTVQRAHATNETFNKPRRSSVAKDSQTNFQLPWRLSYLSFQALTSQS